MHRKLIAAASIAGMLGAWNDATLQHTGIGGICGIAYLGCGAYLVARYMPLHSTLQRLVAGCAIWLAMIAATSGLWYRLWQLDSFSIGLVAITLPLLFLLPHGFSSTPLSISWPQWSRDAWLPVSALLLSVAVATGLLFAVRTDVALRSPWEVTPSIFFIFVFAANVLALELLRRHDSPVMRYVVLALTVGISLSVALIVYAVGYGFDPFVHQATEQAIANSGIITPKPWYYLGQYGLVVFLHGLWQLPISTIDQLLLPFAAALVFPLIALVGKDSSSRALAGAALLALALTPFINTTPWGIALLLFIALVFLDSPLSIHGWIFHIFLAGTSLVVHPLVGIPSALLVALRFFANTPTKLIFISLLGLPILPALFTLQERLRIGPTANATFSEVAPEALSRSVLYLEQQFTLLPDAVYLFGFNSAVLIVLLAILTIARLWRTHILVSHAPLLLLTLLLGANALILEHTISFSFLIEYERADFAHRLWLLALIPLLPFALATLERFFAKLQQANLSVILFFFLLLAAARTAGIYLTYPAFDGYRFDRGYSTSQADLEAVRSIESHAQGPYVVLANQAVSAAALRELGFKTHYQNQNGNGEEIFFYPIPTGGTLYQHYLRMVYENPTRAVAVEAMDVAGVDQAYFVLNDYWFDSEHIGENATASADSHWRINDQLTIFAFQRTL